MFLSLDQILHLLLQYKYLVLFPIVIIEGPIITVIAGFVASMSYMNFFITYGVVVAGDITGDAVYYAIGRWGRENFLDKWGKYIGLNPKKIALVERHFEKHGAGTLLIGKLTHGIGAIFLVVAGLVRMPFLKFISTNLFATLIKSLALLLIGYFFGQAITKINSILEFISAISVSIGIIVALAFFVYYNKKTDEKYK